MSTDTQLKLLPLFRLGRESLLAKQWPEYSEMGFERDDVPALLALANQMTILDDEMAEPDCYASVHAWRVLGTLQAPEARVGTISAA